MAKEEAKTARKDLKDIVDVFDEDTNERDRIMALLERGHQIKKLLGSEPDKKTGKPLKGEPNYGLLAELNDIKLDLQMAQAVHDLEGLRFGRIGAVTNQMDGKSYLSAKKLLAANVTPEQIAAGMEQSDSYYQTTLFELK